MSSRQPDSVLTRAVLRMADIASGVSRWARSWRWATICQVSPARRMGSRGAVPVPRMVPPAARSVDGDRVADHQRAAVAGGPTSRTSGVCRCRAGPPGSSPCRSRSRLSAGSGTRAPTAARRPPDRHPPPPDQGQQRRQRILSPTGAASACEAMRSKPRRGRRAQERRHVCRTCCSPRFVAPIVGLQTSYATTAFRSVHPS